MLIAARWKGREIGSVEEDVASIGSVRPGSEGEYLAQWRAQIRNPSNKERNK